MKSSSNPRIAADGGVAGGEEAEPDDPGQEVPGHPRPGDRRPHHLHEGVQVSQGLHLNNDYL